jgi:hypothetical protein
MGTFSIAFDTIIVGALALPWVLLAVHLFFFDDENRIQGFLDWVVKQNQPAVAGVLLFAVTYSLGSAASRIAQDFLDDDDLHFPAFGRLFRVGVTETSILTDVSCQTQKPKAVSSKPATPDTPTPATCDQAKTSDLEPANSLAEKRQQFRTTDPDCRYTGKWIVQTCDPVTGQRTTAASISSQQDLARDIFQAQEAAVLLQGTDPNERLRQFHDQIMVLRGAAFNGLVAFSLCLFWWIAKRRFKWRWIGPLAYFIPGAIALRNHLLERAPSDPPYMEFTLLILAAAGWWLLWRGSPEGKDLPGAPSAQNLQWQIRFSHLILPAFLAITAFLGWWATEVLYDQQVIYSYQALSDAPAKSPKSSQK